MSTIEARAAGRCRSVTWYGEYKGGGCGWEIQRCRAKYRSLGGYLLGKNPHVSRQRHGNNPKPHVGGHSPVNIRTYNHGLLRIPSHITRRLLDRSYHARGRVFIVILRLIHEKPAKHKRTVRTTRVNIRESIRAFELGLALAVKWLRPL